MNLATIFGRVCRSCTTISLSLLRTVLSVGGARDQNIVEAVRLLHLLVLTMHHIPLLSLIVNVVVVPL